MLELDFSADILFPFLVLYMCYFLDGVCFHTVGICVIFSTGFVLTPLVYVLFSRRDSF